MTVRALTTTEPADRPLLLNGLHYLRGIGLIRRRSGWITPYRFSKITGIGPIGSGGPIPSINTVTSAARRIASIKLQGNRRACCGDFQDTRGMWALSDSLWEDPA